MKELLPFKDVQEILKAGKRIAHIDWQKGEFIFLRPADVLPQAVVQKAVSIPQAVKDVLADKGDIPVTEYPCYWDGEKIWNGIGAYQFESDMSQPVWIVLD